MAKKVEYTTFRDWMKAVDAAVGAILGCSVYDLPDCCFADWYEDGVSPKSAARKAIKAAKEEGY